MEDLFVLVVVSCTKNSEKEKFFNLIKILKQNFRFFAAIQIKKEEKNDNLNEIMDGSVVFFWNVVEKSDFLFV